MRLHASHSSHLSATVLLSFLLIPPASSHGYLSHPPARHAGPSTLSACGKPVVDAILRDNTSHIEGLPDLGALPNSGYDPALCNLWLCRGLQFGDNADGVQVWKAGDVVGIKIKLTIPHDGAANVSLVDAKRNEIIEGGGLLMSWPTGYANEDLFFRGELPRNETGFNVTVPELGGRCGVPGECVLQWWWYAKGAKQTYESCVDFVMMPSHNNTRHDDGGDAGSGWMKKWWRWISLPSSRPWTENEGKNGEKSTMMGVVEAIHSRGGGEVGGGDLTAGHLGWLTSKSVKPTDRSGTGLHW